MKTTLIRGGRLIDGTGNTWKYGDVLLQGDRIVQVGVVSETNADQIIDAEGMLVSPGFIDIHTHSDIPLLVDGRADSHIRQGVTTNAIGNCGNSAFPLTDEMVEMWGGKYGGIDINWRSLADYLGLLEQQGISVNLVPFVGHGTIRTQVMGYRDVAPTPAELTAMRAVLAETMEQGAFGLTTGLTYVPGIYSETAEIIELAKVVAQYGGVYASHVRGENDTLIAAVAEAIEVGRQAQLPVQIAHFKAMGRHMWGKSVETLQMVDDARSEGIEVTCDQYPYNASATGLGSYLPGWAHIGGKDEFLKRLADPGLRLKIKTEIVDGTPDWASFYKGVGWENTYVNQCKRTEWQGLSVSQIAAQEGKDDFDMAFDLLIENEGNVPVVYFTIGDEDIERIMRHPAVMVGSDSSPISVEGPLFKGRPHPRSSGTFVRVLGHYVREKKVITLEEAVRKMTSAPAQKLGLTDRGLLCPGFKADIVIFNPETVGSTSTYADPFQYATGIEHVFVNGTHTIVCGEHIGAKAGQVLRHRK